MVVDGDLGLPSKSDCDNGWHEVVQVVDGNSGVAVSAASVRA